MIVVLDGDVEKGHDCIAQQAVHDSMVLSYDPGARLEKFFRHRSHLFDPKLLSQASVFPTIGEEYRYLRETARLPVQLSPVAEIWIYIATSHAPDPPHPPHEPSKGHTVRQAPERQRRNRESGHIVSKSTLA